MRVKVAQNVCQGNTGIINTNTLLPAEPTGKMSDIIVKVQTAMASKS